MTWYCYCASHTSPLLKQHALQTTTVTLAWLKNITRQLQDALNAVPNAYIDAVKEAIVSYPTMHHFDDFQQQYLHALNHIAQQGHQVDEHEESYVFWLPSADGYCHCAFLLPLKDQHNSTMIVSPVDLPMLAMAS